MIAASGGSVHSNERFVHQIQIAFLRPMPWRERHAAARPPESDRRSAGSQREAFSTFRGILEQSPDRSFRRALREPEPPAAAAP